MNYPWEYRDTCLHLLLCVPSIPLSLHPSITPSLYPSILFLIPSSLHPPMLLFFHPFIPLSLHPSTIQSLTQVRLRQFVKIVVSHHSFSPICPQSIHPTNRITNVSKLLHSNHSALFSFTPELCITGVSVLSGLTEALPNYCSVCTCRRVCSTYQELLQMGL